MSIVGKKVMVVLDPSTFEKTEALIIDKITIPHSVIQFGSNTPTYMIDRSREDVIAVVSITAYLISLGTDQKFLRTITPGQIKEILN